MRTPATSVGAYTQTALGYCFGTPYFLQKALRDASVWKDDAKHSATDLESAPPSPSSSVSSHLMMGLSWIDEEELMMQREEEEEDIEHGSVWCCCRRLVEEERRGF